jgi:hypothetical protein
MKIRSITSFWDPRLEAGLLKIPEDFGQFRARAASRFQEAGFEVQTTRLATVEFPTYLDCHKGVKVVIKQVKDLEEQAKAAGFEDLSFGPATPPAGAGVYDMIPDLLAASSIAFFSSVMAAYGVMYPHFVRKCAQIIRANREIEPEGFANLRFAALAQVRPGSPFFPAAYHRGGGPAFALAIECADEAVQAFASAHSLGEARRLLINGLNDKAR